MGDSKGRSTSLGTTSTPSRFCAIVLPVHVRQSPCSSPRTSSTLSSCGRPPAASKSPAYECAPCGLRLESSGTRSPIALKSSTVSATSASRAMASRCSTAFVEPPSANMTVMAFSNDLRVMMSRARVPARSIPTSAFTESTQSWNLVGCTVPLPTIDFVTAWCDELPGSDIPIPSNMAAMVDAVYMAPHAPVEPRQRRSISCSSSMSIFPAANAPGASYAAPASSFCPKNDSQEGQVPSVSPGRRPPPYIVMPMLLPRAIGISAPGCVLSHPPIVIMASQR